MEQIRTWVFILICLLSSNIVFPQSVDFKAKVDLVRLLVSVRDDKGKIVRGLSPEDFILEEEGHPRPIEYFSQENDLPLVLGLLVDTSMSQRSILEEERQASHHFLEQIMRPAEDLTFVISFDVEAALLADLTGSPAEMSDALSRLSLPQQPGRGGVGTVLYDSVFLAGEEILRHETARKAMIILSDGQDFGSTVALEEALESAHRSDSILYAIRYYDKNGPGRRGGFGRGGGRGRGGSRGGNPMPIPRSRPSLEDGKKILTRMAEQTGGLFFEVGKKLSLSEIFSRIEEDLRHHYTLGFRPSAEGEPGLRRLALKAKNPRHVVQTRDSYYYQP